MLLHFRNHIQGIYHPVLYTGPFPLSSTFLRVPGHSRVSDSTQLDPVLVSYFTATAPSTPQWCSSPLRVALGPISHSPWILFQGQTRTSPKFLHWGLLILHEYIGVPPIPPLQTTHINSLRSFPSRPVLRKSRSFLNPPIPFHPGFHSSRKCYVLEMPLSQMSLPPFPPAIFVQFPPLHL
jgi:hypothetical protein